MKTTRLALAAVVVGALLAPSASTASHCGSNVVIFSTIDAARSNLEPQGLPTAINSSSVTCSAAEHDADSRLINPGSDVVRVRYVSTCAVGDEATPAQTIQGRIAGLGLDQAITLTCDVDPLLGGNPRFQSGWIAIDPTAIGCVTASIDGTEESNTFHTVGQVGCF